jgi:AMMECR1 domain-containing protein
MRFLVVVVLALIVTGCQPVWHLQDRHVEAWNPVAAYGRTHTGTTLVLLDYHPDSGGLRFPRNSTNWVGHLVDEGLVTRVFWVSAQHFGPGQRESRRHWLERLMSDDDPVRAQRVMAAYTIADGDDLKAWTPPTAWVLSIDSDVLAHDAGSRPSDWLTELGAWTEHHRPEVGAWALSAAYQPDAAAAWAWTQQWWSQPWMAGVRSYWEGGPQGAYAESGEEATAWRSWSSGRPFWPGASVWQGAPVSLRRILVERAPVPVDAVASAALSAWRDADRAALEAQVPDQKLQEWQRLAVVGVESALTRGAPTEPATDPDSDLGLAVRVTDPNVDRGCLAWYRGVAQPEPVLAWCASQALVDPRYPPVRANEAPGLSVEVSVFGPWRPLADPKAFRLGWDSLLLVANGQKTLLQSSLAVERGYDVDVFLERLSRKAGLGPDGWKAKGVTFLSSATLFLTAPLASGSKRS